MIGGEEKRAGGIDKVTPLVRFRTSGAFSFTSPQRIPNRFGFKHALMLAPQNLNFIEVL